MCTNRVFGNMCGNPTENSIEKACRMYMHGQPYVVGIKTVMVYKEYTAAGSIVIDKSETCDLPV